MSKLFKPAFIGSVLTMPIGAFLKILNLSGGDFVFIISLLLTATYVIIGLYEINNSNKLSDNERAMWTSTIVVFTPIGGLLYVLLCRERLFREYKILRR
jgi:hypothetical protein